MKNTNTNLHSKHWQSNDTAYISERLSDIGFEDAGEILELRVFDLLNLNRIDAEAGKEIILALYRFYNPNTVVDEGMEMKAIDQYFPFTIWRKKHRDLSAITVRDLVMAEDINRKAILHFYNSILKAFYKSREYSCREYRYRDYWEMLREKEGRK